MVNSHARSGQADHNNKVHFVLSELLGGWWWGGVADVVVCALPCGAIRCIVVLEGRQIRTAATVVRAARVASAPAAVAEVVIRAVRSEGWAADQLRACSMGQASSPKGAVNASRDIRHPPACAR